MLIEHQRLFYCGCLVSVVFSLKEKKVENDETLICQNDAQTSFGAVSRAFHTRFLTLSSLLEIMFIYFLIHPITWLKSVFGSNNRLLSGVSVNYGVVNNL